MVGKTVNVNRLNRTVQKEFTSKIARDKEVFVYRTMQETGLVPKLIEKGPWTLILDYISGETLSRREVTVEDYVLLTNWLIDFQEAFYQKTRTYCCLEDMNFSNFIVHEGCLIGIDFEYWEKGSKERAFALCLAQIKLMRCEENLKEEIDSYMYTQFCQASIKKEDLDRHIKEEVQKLSRWRKIQPLMRQTTSALLIGGEGRRLGGVEKQNLVLDRYTFLEHLVYELAIFDEHLYSLREAKAWEVTDGRVVIDAIKNKGPAIGIHSLFGVCKTPYLFLWSCDMPLLDRTFIMTLFEQAYTSTLEKIHYHVFVPQIKGKMYPLSALYHVSSKRVFKEAIQQDQLRVQSILEELVVKEIPFSKQEEALINVNREEDLIAIRRVAKNKKLN